MAAVKEEPKTPERLPTMDELADAKIDPATDETTEIFLDNGYRIVCVRPSLAKQIFNRRNHDRLKFRIVANPNKK